MNPLLAPAEVDYRLIAESIPHIVWVTDPNGTTEFLNDQAAQYTGLTPGAHLDAELVALLHPGDAERAHTGWERAVRTHKSFEVDCRIRRIDGEFRWHTFRAAPVLDSDGRVAKWIGTATDIEERKRLEDALRRSERKAAEGLSLLATLQAAAPVGCGFVDRDFRIVHMNETLALVNGAPLESQVGRTIAEVVPELWPRLEPLYRQVLDTGTAVVNVEVSGTMAGDDGRPHFWLASYYPVRLGDEIIGTGVVVVDITEHREAEQAHDALMHAAVAAMATTVEVRDPYTAGHQRRVALISRAIALELGLDPDTVEGIALAASLHDIGKISVPAEILSRPGALTPAELELVKGHPCTGFEIIAGIDFPWPISDMVLHHHERIDGSGYPDALRGEQIGIGARIIAVADTVEAMASHRPYRPARGIEAALATIERGRGTLFDPRAVDACRKLFADGRIALQASQ